MNMLESILNIWRSLFPIFPGGIQGYALLALRTGLGVLFVLHGYPKLIHLKTWSKALGMPLWLCFLSAFSMFLGGFCLIAGFLTPFACVALLCSMVFALVLEITQGLPFVAPDPYLIPEGEYEGADGKGEPPSQEKAFVFILMLVTLLILGAGSYSLDALILGVS